MYIQNNLQKKMTILAFLLPSVLGLTIFIIVPFTASIIFSFFDYDTLKPFSASTFVGLGNYAELLGGEELYQVLSHTLYYMVLYIPLVLVTSTFVAGLMNQSLKGIGFYKVLFYIPVITSWVAGALIWRWVLNAKYGYLNQWLGLLGIQGPNWLSDEVWAMPGIVLAALWKDTGYYALIILAALKGINKEYYEAAEIDGASLWKKFSRVTLPLLTPTLFLLVIINVIGGFQVFDSVFVMTGGGPNNATTVIVERIYRNAFRFYRMGYASAYAWVLFVIIFACTLVQLKLQRKWVNYDA